MSNEPRDGALGDFRCQATATPWAPGRSSPVACRARRITMTAFSSSQSRPRPGLRSGVRIPRCFVIIFVAESHSQRIVGIVVAFGVARI